jgi:hypothetical protein
MPPTSASRSRAPGVSVALEEDHLAVFREFVSADGQHVAGKRHAGAEAAEGGEVVLGENRDRAPAVGAAGVTVEDMHGTLVDDADDIGAGRSHRDGVAGDGHAHAEIVEARGIRRDELSLLHPGAGDGVAHEDVDGSRELVGERGPDDKHVAASGEGVAYAVVFGRVAGDELGRDQDFAGCGRRRG